ncbi:MAG: PQQ-dependent sugar dehydrogenase [Methanospirillum sp.]
MSSTLKLVLLALFIAGFALCAGCTIQVPGGNATATPTTAPAVTDLTNQNSPEAAAFTTYPSTTKLHAPDVAVGLKRIAGGFTSPSMVADPKDGSGRLFLVDQTGYVKIFYANGTVVDQPFLDVRDRMVNLSPTYDERGLLSIAFHPQFATNGRVFAYYSAPLRAGVDPNWSCTNHLSEFRVSSSNPNQVNMSSEKVLLLVDKPYQNHNGGFLLFGPTDGYLYLPLGDGGRADDTGMGHIPGTGNAQNLTTLLGKVIRIDVNSVSAGKQYGIPADNPFLSNATIPPEIYAYGFRNPAFATFDSGGSHHMFIAMAGQRLFESVLIVYKGGDYPWNIREGTHCFDPSNDFAVPNTTCRITGYSGQPLIGPVVELGHDVGDTIVGGVVYRGSGLGSSLQGSYVFGTWSDESRTVGNGTLLIATPPPGLDTATLPDAASSLTAAQNAMWTTKLVTVANNPNGRINAFVRGMFEDSNHEVLVLINQNGGPGLTPQNSGEVWMMVPASTPGLVVIGGGGATTAPTGTSSSATTATATRTATTTATVTATATPTPAGTGSISGVKWNDQNADHQRDQYEPRLAGWTIVLEMQEANGPNFNEVARTTTDANGVYSFTGLAAGHYRVSEVAQSGWTQTFPTDNAGTHNLVISNGQPSFTGQDFGNAAGAAATTATTTAATTAATATTTAATATATATATAPGGGTTITALTLTAKNIAFDKSSLSAPAGATVVLAFVNNDAGVPHNFALYTDSSATTTLFKGAIVTGQVTTTYTFTAPSTPGTYFYRCDVHPETMTGTFTVT